MNALFFWETFYWFTPFFMFEVIWNRTNTREILLLLFYSWSLVLEGKKGVSCELIFHEHLSLSWTSMGFPGGRQEAAGWGTRAPPPGPLFQQQLLWTICTVRGTRRPRVASSLSNHKTFFKH